MFFKMRYDLFFVLRLENVNGRLVEIDDFDSLDQSSTNFFIFG